MCWNSPLRGYLGLQQSLPSPALYAAVVCRFLSLAMGKKIKFVHAAGQEV